MFVNKKVFRVVIVLLFAVGVASLASCSGDIPLIQTTPTQTSTSTSSPQPTLTSTPTVTPLPPVGVLLAPPEADTRLVKALQTRMSAWMREEGLRFQTLPALELDDFALDTYQYVVAVPPVDNLGTLVQGAPSTNFLAIGFEGFAPASNLTTIGGNGLRLEIQAFLAGYIAAMITPDYRVGMIGVADSPDYNTLQKAFTNGALFFCAAPMGSCAPNYAPFYEYPLFTGLNSGGTAAEWRSVAQYLINLEVDTMYIMPGAGDDAMLRHLAESGVNMIGGRTPPQDVMNHWVVTLAFSPLQVLDDYWPDFVQGNTGLDIDIPVSLEDVNSALLSEGKQRLVQEMLDEIYAGLIDPLGEPVSGGE